MSKPTLESGFLQDIAARPDDQARRLIYADWLDEQNDPRAELIRVNCELSSLPEVQQKKRDALIQRETELLQTSQDKHWLRIVFLPRLEPQPSSAPNEPGEQFHLTNPGGLFEIVHDDFGYGLRIDGQPIALNWDDCQGSVGQVLIQTGIGSTLEDDLEQLRDVASGNLYVDQSLIEQIRPLLLCMQTGTYRVWLVEDARPNHVHWFHRGQKPQVSEWYPYDSEIITTQPFDSIQEERVTFWREQLQAGERPVMLLGRCVGQWCDFLIDGHHKLVAAEQARLPIRAIVIERQLGEPISENVADFFKKARRTWNQYRRLRGR